MAYTDAQFNNTSYSSKPAASNEVFSVTINPELVNLFWGLYKRSDSSSVGGADTGPPLESVSLPFFIEPISSAQSTSVQQSQYFIFGYQLPIDADDSFTKSVLNVLRQSVITTGIVILVGLGSYCTFWSLQKLRRLFSKDSNAESWPALKSNSDSAKATDNTNIPNATNYSAPSISQKTDSGNCSDMEALKLGLTLDLKNGKKESPVNINPDKDLQTFAGKRKKGKGRPSLEGQHFSPSPVLSNINRGNAFVSHQTVPKEGRVLVGGDQEYTFRGDDDEFQIEYFGPARSSSSSTLSDHSDGDDIYPDPYKHHIGSGFERGATIQTMISPSHSQAATVRRQLDFGDVSPIPSAGPAPSYHPHHHLPPLSASSSMSLSPSTPTTGDLTSPTFTSSTPQPPMG